MTSPTTRPQKSGDDKSPLSPAAAGIAGAALGAAIGWKGKEVISSIQEPSSTTHEFDQDTQPSSTHSPLHGLQGTEVREEIEIAPVLDTVEEAGASHDELLRLEALIRHNIQQGVAVVFGSEYGTGVMGAYDPENNFILITPETVDMGVDETMKTLLHETVHAHQDIADGLDNETMQSLGLEINTEGVEYVEENYSGLSQEETIIELESNSSEHNVDETFEELDVDI